MEGVNKRWLNRKQAAEFLGISNITFGKLMEQDRVTPNRLAEGTRVGCDKEELKKPRGPKDQTTKE